MNAITYGKFGNLSAKGNVITLASASEMVLLDLTDVSPAVREAAMLYGLQVRIERASAPFKDNPSGGFAARAALMAHYASGTEEWNLKVSPEAKAAAKLAADRAMLVRAFERVYPGDKRRGDGEKNISALMASKGMTEKDAIAFWLGVGNIAEEVRNIIAEDAAKAAKTPTVEDAGKLLDELLKEKA